MAKITNGTERHVSAHVGGEWYHVAPGDSVTVDDPRTALTLGEYGLTVEDYVDVVTAQDVPVTEGETRHTGGGQHRIDDPRANEPGTPVTETGDTGSTTFDPGVQGVTAERHEDGAANRVEGDDPAQLKGAALDAALEAAGLPRTGTADEKRARLAEHVGRGAVESTSGEPQPDPILAEADAATLRAYAEANGLDVPEGDDPEALRVAIEAARAAGEATQPGGVVDPAADND